MRKSLGKRVLAGVACVVGGAALAAGCSGGGEPGAEPSVLAGESASPSASPSVDPAEALKQQNIEAAKSLIEDYEQQVSIVENNGGGDWADLSVFFSDGDILSRVSQVYESWDNEYHSTGSYTVKSQTVTGYDGTAGRESVKLDVCIDRAGVDLFKGSEPVALSDNLLTRRVEFLLVRQSETYWTIDELTESGESC